MATKYYTKTAQLFKDNGFKIGKVERYIPNRGNFVGGKRVDLFNIIDAIAIEPGRLIGVQSCGSGDFRAHIVKATNEHRAELIDWLKSGALFCLCGWRKLKQKKKDGSYSKLSKYVPRVCYIQLDSEDYLTMIERDYFFNLPPNGRN